MADGQAPLSRQTSSTAPIPSDRLPEEVVACLQNARFLHLATCNSNEPHVSLMNYTYLPPSIRPPTSQPATAAAAVAANTSLLPPGPAIIMTSNPTSKKTINLLANPNVSLLVHDWVSARPPAAPAIPGVGVSNDGLNRDRSPDGGGAGGARRQSTLAGMLMQMNAAAMSSISATLNGCAHVLPVGAPEEKWCKARHLANNTFGGEEEEEEEEESTADLEETLREIDEEGGEVGAVASRYPRSAAHRTPALASAGREGDGGRESYIRDEEARVVVVELRDGRISDWKGGVKDWVIRGAGEGRLVNGV